MARSYNHLVADGKRFLHRLSFISGVARERRPGADPAVQTPRVIIFQDLRNVGELIAVDCTAMPFAGHQVFILRLGLGIVMHQCHAIDQIITIRQAEPVPKLMSH